MSFNGIDIFVVKPGHVVRDEAKGVDYVVHRGAMVFDGRGSAWCVQEDFDALKRHAGGKTGGAA